jgi:hypothetical protein
MTKEDKYLATKALEWFDGVKDRVWKWVFDEGHFAAIMYFVLGALVVHFVPDAIDYFWLAIVVLFILLLIVSCLVPIAWFVEWALRKAFL